MKFINKKLAMAVCMVLSVSACLSDKTSTEYLSDAKVSISNSQDEAAIIALKNAVRVDLKNAEARLLLGSLYLKVGDSTAAEKELSRAFDLTGDVKRILPKLLKALNLQNKNDEMLALIRDLEETTPEILLYQYLAYDRLGQKDEATQSLLQAKELSTESIYSQLGEAYLKTDLSDADGALENINKILVTDPNMTEALLLKGQLHFARKEFSNAIEAFNAYHRLLPKDIQIRLFLANAYIKNEQFEQASEHLDFLLKVSPEHPFTNQLKGVVYYQNSDYTQALAHTRKAIQNGMGSISSRIIAGLSAFKLEQYELAHQYLASLSGLPATHPVQRVLAIIQMQLGYNVDAGITLAELEDLTPQDISLFTTASFEMLKEGRVEEAKALLAKTDAVSIGSSKEMTKIGVLKLSMNDLEGLVNLEKAVEIDPNSSIAKISLAAAYIKTNEYSKALTLAEEWKKSHPDQVEGYNLAAKIYLLSKDSTNAEREFNLALKINEHNPHSLLYFANKALADGKPKESIKRLEQLLSSSPNHLEALILNYNAYKAINNTNLAIEKIANSFINNSDILTYRLLYARVLFIEEQFGDVINLLEDIKNEALAPTLQWVLLGDSYLKLKKNAEALVVYDKWVVAQPTNRIAWVNKILVQEKNADYHGALSTVDKALLNAPDDGQFNVLRANYLILLGEYRKAQVQINTLTDEQKLFPLVRGLQSKIWLSEENFTRAIPGLLALYEISPNSYNVAILFATHIKLGQEKLAFDFIQKHVESFPEDNISRNLLAESAITYNQALAKIHYLVLLKSAPENLSILNNLAWLEYLLANYEEAFKYINKAMNLKANHPQILDTAGLIELKLGNKSKAIALLKKAKLLSPNDETIAENYQKAMAQ